MAKEDHEDLKSDRVTIIHEGKHRRAVGCSQGGENEIPDAVESVAAEAARIVAERCALYGPPEINLKRTAEYWSLMLGDKLSASLDAADVARCMIGVKLARLHETPDHRDSMVDGCGYFDCLARVTG